MFVLLGLNFSVLYEFLNFLWWWNYEKCNHDQEYTVILSKLIFQNYTDIIFQIWFQTKHRSQLEWECYILKLHFKLDVNLTLFHFQICDIYSLIKEFILLLNFIRFWRWIQISSQRPKYYTGKSDFVRKIMNLWKNMKGEKKIPLFVRV